MALTDIEAVRLKTSDQPIRRRNVWEGDGQTTEFKLDYTDVTDDTVEVYLDGVLLDTFDYTIDAVNGIVELSLPAAANAVLVVEYTTVAFTDAEVEHFLGEAASNTWLAAALMLTAWAARASQAALKHTVAGGASIGTVTEDTAVKARELRESAKGMYQMYELFLGSEVAAESITEVAWTEQMIDRVIENHLLDNL